MKSINWQVLGFSFSVAVNARDCSKQDRMDWTDLLAIRGLSESFSNTTVQSSDRQIPSSRIHMTTNRWPCWKADADELSKLSITLGPSRQLCNVMAHNHQICEYVGITKVSRSSAVCPLYLLIVMRPDLVGFLNVSCYLKRIWIHEYLI